MMLQTPIRPQLNPHDFSVLVTFLKPFLQEFVVVHRLTTSPLQKATLEAQLFQKFIDALQSGREGETFITFLSENWQKFMNDLAMDALLQKLERDQTVGLQSKVQEQPLQTFLKNLNLFFGVEEESALPASGLDFIQKLHTRLKELNNIKNTEILKIKWLDLFNTKDLSSVHLDDLVNMIENFNHVLQLRDPEFDQAARLFFGGRQDPLCLTSKEMIQKLKIQTNLKTITTPKHHLLLREILAWDQYFSQLQKNQMPDERKLAALIKKWPSFLDDMLNMSMEPVSSFSKASTHFFKTVKKIFGTQHVPLTIDELIKFLHQRINRIESDERRVLFINTLNKAVKLNHL